MFEIARFSCIWKVARSEISSTAADSVSPRALMHVQFEISNYGLCLDARLVRGEIRRLSLDS